MRTVTVNASSKYEILIKQGILQDAGKHIKEKIGAVRLCIITDDTVNDLYANTLEKSLENENLEHIKFVIPHGESSKSTENLVSILEFLAKNHITRSDAIVALGGGVVGDISGFCAGVYLRGIKFVQIPTTLLSAVDSSVGGKTAVNLKAGKNLAGVFHQPSLVLCDPKTLDTLPNDTFCDGCAEVIKYGIINDSALFKILKTGIRNNIEEIIERCVKNKADIVEKDEFDTGIRQLLNLGHTTGHAIEICSDLSVSHGQAVAIGMCMATKIAVSMNICPESDLHEIRALIKKEGLPTCSPFNAKELASIASADKKREGGKINFILPCGIGNCKAFKIDVKDLESFIAKGL